MGLLILDVFNRIGELEVDVGGVVRELSVCPLGKELGLRSVRRVYCMPCLCRDIGLVLMLFLFISIVNQIL